MTDVPQSAGADPLEPQPLEQTQTLVLGLTSKLEAYAQPLLAQRLGEFRKENLNVEFKYVPAADLQLLLHRGDIDAAAGTLNAGVLNLMASGSGTKIVMPGVGLDESSMQGFWINDRLVNPGGDELVANDFRGAKLMAPAGSGGTYAAIFHNYVKALLGGEDFDPADLLVESAPDSATTVEALKSGAVAVGKVNSPLDRNLAEAGCCTFLAGALNSESAVWFFGPSLEKHVDRGAAFVRAMARTTRTHLGQGYRNNTATMDALAGVLEVDPAALRSLPPLYFDPQFALHEETALGLQSYFRSVDLLDYSTDFTAEEVYDTRYLKAIGSGE